MRIEISDKTYKDLISKKYNSLFYYWVRGNMKLIIESVEKNKELFPYITPQSLDNYKSYYNILLKMKETYSLIDLQNLIVF